MGRVAGGGTVGSRESREVGMDEATRTTLSDDEMITEVVGSSALLETPPRDADGTDGDGVDGDGTDTDGTDSATS
jgi:hypothetical protein